MRAIRRALPAAAFFLMAACATGGMNAASYEAQSQPVSVVSVTNDHFDDMILYAVVDGMRHRLGHVARMETAIFELPPQGVNATGEIELIAQPVGSLPPKTSRPLYYRPGQNLRAKIMDSDAPTFGAWVDASPVTRRGAQVG